MFLDLDSFRLGCIQHYPYPQSSSSPLIAQWTGLKNYSLGCFLLFSPFVNLDYTERNFDYQDIPVPLEIAYNENQGFNQGSILGKIILDGISMCSRKV